MHWVIGLDLRPSGSGALELAAWRSRLQGVSPLQATAVHVLEESYLLQVLRREHLAEVEGRAAEEARLALERVGLSNVQAQIVRGIVADERLAQEVENLGADVLVIGRQATRDEIKLVRLGRVARRLVRRLPVPVIVAPPDLRAHSMGEGPVLLATDLADDSEPAAEFARRLAADVGRSILVAHIVGEPDDSRALIPAVTIEQFYSQVGLDREHDLQGWMKRHDLGDAAAVVATGNVVEHLLGIAEQERVSFIVCGSRGLGTVERLFTSSVATDLSRHAACPVAVVPPLI